MNTLPHVAAALICERVIEEKDGDISAIRIIDRAETKIRIEGKLPPPEKLNEIVPTLQLAMLVGLKSGSFKGKGVVEIDGESPNGTVKRLGLHEFEFLGSEHGQNLIVNLLVQVKEEGLHWFNVKFNGELLTRIPLRLSRTVESVGEKTTGSPKVS